MLPALSAHAEGSAGGDHSRTDGVAPHRKREKAGPLARRALSHAWMAAPPINPGRTRWGRCYTRPFVRIRERSRHLLPHACGGAAGETLPARRPGAASPGGTAKHIATPHKR